MFYRRLRKQKTKLNKRASAGFSLVELLVAVAILAIIVTPFLMAFLTSTRMNARITTTENATAAGTNMMEYVKGSGSTKMINNAAAVAYDKYDKPVIHDQTDTSTTAYDEDGNKIAADKIADVVASGKKIHYGYTDAELTNIAYYLYTTKQTVNGRDYAVETRVDASYKTEQDENGNITAASLNDQTTDYNASPPVTFTLKGGSHIAKLDTTSVDKLACAAIASLARTKGENTVTEDTVYNANLNGKGYNGEFHKEVVVLIDTEEREFTTGSGTTETREVYVVKTRSFYAYQQLNAPLTSTNTKYRYTNGDNKTYRYSTEWKTIFTGEVDVNKDSSDLQQVYIANTSIPIVSVSNLSQTAEMFTIINRTKFRADVSLYQLRDINSAEGQQYNRCRFLSSQVYMVNAGDTMSDGSVASENVYTVSITTNSELYRHNFSSDDELDWFQSAAGTAAYGPVTATWGKAWTPYETDSTDDWITVGEGEEGWYYSENGVYKWTRDQWWQEYWLEWTNNSYYNDQYELKAGEKFWREGAYVYKDVYVLPTDYDYENYIVLRNSDGACVTYNQKYATELKAYLDKTSATPPPLTGCYPVPYFDGYYITGTTQGGSSGSKDSLSATTTNAALKRIYTVTVSVYDASVLDNLDENGRIEDGATPLINPALTGTVE